MEIFIRASGGRYFRIDEGRATRWNPLQLPDSPAQRAFLADWFEVLLTDTGGEPLNADDRQRIQRAVEGIFDFPIHDRVLRNIAPMFGNAHQDKLGKRLITWYTSPLHGVGRFAWLFDNDQNELDLSNPILGFDLTKILDIERARPAVLMWIFHLIESLVDGQPIALFADEGWRLLQDETVTRRLENFELVIRKNNGLLAFATQAPEAIQQSPIAPALKQQSETMILFPNIKAEQEVYCDYLGLNLTQFNLIKRTLPERGEPGWFLIKNSLGAAICRLDLRGMDDYIAVLSGNKNTVRLMDELIATHGEAPAQWLPHFYARWRFVSAVNAQKS